jgi:hypothetical protein
MPLLRRRRQGAVDHLMAGRFREGVVSEGLTELTDLAPTIAELAGLPPVRTHGNSLVPILSGDADPRQNHGYVRCEYYDALASRRLRGSSLTWRPGPPCTGRSVGSWGVSRPGLRRTLRSGPRSGRVREPLGEQRCP